MGAKVLIALLGAMKSMFGSENFTRAILTFVENKQERKNESFEERKEVRVEDAAGDAEKERDQNRKRDERRDLKHDFGLRWRMWRRKRQEETRKKDSQSSEQGVE